MFGMFKSNENYEFDNSSIIADNFILLSYVDTSYGKGLYLLGTDTQKKKFKLIISSSKSKIYKDIALENIVNINPITINNSLVFFVVQDCGDKDGDKNDGMVDGGKDDGDMRDNVNINDNANDNNHTNNNHSNNTNDKHTNTSNTSLTAILNNKTNHINKTYKLGYVEIKENKLYYNSLNKVSNVIPSIIEQNNRVSIIGMYNGECFIKDINGSEYATDWKLGKNHSFSYLRIDDKDIFIFLETKNTGKSINFYTNDKKKIYNSIVIKEDISNFIISDFDSNGIIDIAYITLSGDTPYLVIHMNVNSKKYYEYRRTFKDLGLNDGCAIDGGKFYVIDTTSDGYPDIFIITAKKELRLLKNIQDGNKRKFEYKPLKGEIMHKRNIESICTFKMNGKYAIVVNYNSGEECDLIAYENIMLKNKLRLILNTTRLKRYDLMHYNVTYRFLANDSLRIGYQAIQTSYINLYNYSFIGLGGKNKELMDLEVYVPYKNRKYLIPSRIIPNSELYIQPVKNNDSPRIDLFLTLGEYKYLVAIIMIGILILNMITVLFLCLKEKRRREKIKKEEVNQFNFEAL
ncbi:hypothetical protein SLOPH_233 [Spraguea lophii 42_110]|uniref:Uncharacterized protein n=1 Tax=Spraguea lophii (strain 42_110) TaxID=1358809 RepID=S7W7Y1_SPRLO|nr:hypothetical protein SLOPH_233 [Spraguea lophii 42_110]